MLVRLFLTCAIIISTNIAHPHNKIGNGGGGIISPLGEYALLTSILNENKYSGADTKIENCGSAIFSEIRSDIRKMQSFLPKKVGIFLINNVCQGVFYRRLPTSASPIDKRSHLLSISHFQNVYSLAAGLEKKEIVIYAITRPNDKKTFFMPEFYKLTYMKQKVILFHEIFWLYFHTNNTVKLELKEEVKLYRKMLNLEQALINYLENSDDINCIQNFSNALNSFK